MSNKTVRISVRALIEFILKSGSIDSRYMSASRLQDGIRIHQKLQKLKKKEAVQNGYLYESEYRFKHLFAYKNLDFCIVGRADGLFCVAGRVFIDEIKSTATPLDLITDDENHIHWAQAKFYGYMYCVQENISDITISLIYCPIEEAAPNRKIDLDKVKTFSREFDFKTLEIFFFDIIEKYYIWAQMETEKKYERDISIKASGFPYGQYRTGQREFAVMAYRAIQNRQNLFIEAPTGTGKTISALFPAVKALGESLADKIFYLTAKTITRQAAENAVQVMKASGYLLSCITLTAKDKICFLPMRSCNPTDCPYAAGHFDRVNDALWDILNNYQGQDQTLTRTIIESYARKHNVCPHEFSLDISLWVDIVICDYNYAFDPKASLKRFFGDVPSGDFLLLTDESHNLVERAREMFSAGLNKNDFSALRKEFKGKDKPLYKILGEISKNISALAKQISPEKRTFTTANEPEELYLLLTEFIELADSRLSDLTAAENPELYSRFLQLYFSSLDFLRVSEDFDERYTVYIEKTSYGTTVKLLCLDPSYLLAKVLAKTISAVFFSATLTPLDYFKNVLGGSEDDKTARLPSPFDKSNLKVLIDSTISTRYKDREESYERIADALFYMVKQKKGNYFAFFSSYDYLTKVYDIFSTKYAGVNNGNGIETLLQRQNMTEEERECFLGEFIPGRLNSMLAFCVLGGIFSEGIDLTGDRLIGTAVIGVGLPSISDERDVLMRYYNRFNMGFEYAYMYPGMNKVLQAAGRVIRTHTDRGVILLIDDRFATYRYTELFPHLWLEYSKINSKSDYFKLINQFWAD